MNTTIKITTIEEARKWVGRTAYVGYGRVADAPPRHMSTEPALLTQPQPVPAGSFAFGGYTSPRPHYQGQGAIWIELLDGPAHPRPEGEGWAWCQTSEDAQPFAGKHCEVSAPTGALNHGARDDRGPLSLGRSNHLLLGDPDLRQVSLDDRGGAWIREAPGEVDPVAVAHEARLRSATRTAVEGLFDSEASVDPVAVAHAAYVEASDAAEAADLEASSARLKALRLARLLDKAKEREAEDARYPLREGWAWGKYANYKEIAAISQKQGRPCGVFVDPDGDLRQVWELNGSSYCDTYAPLDVARAVIARYDATRAND